MALSMLERLRVIKEVQAATQQLGSSNLGMMARLRKIKELNALTAQLTGKETRTDDLGDVEVKPEQPVEEPVTEEPPADTTPAQGEPTMSRPEPEEVPEMVRLYREDAYLDQKAPEFRKTMRAVDELGLPLDELITGLENWAKHNGFDLDKEVEDGI